VRVLTGSDLRRYRKLLGMTQTQFARQLGLAQATLSQIEGGRIALSNEHLQKLGERFKSARFKPTFAEFQRGVEQGMSQSQAALAAPRARYCTLSVWAWEDGFDLGRVPAPDSAVDLVTVRACDKPVIALQVGRQTDHWEAGETFVFEQCSRDDVQDGDICLLQVRPPRARATKTMIAIAHIAPGKRGRALHFEPVSPSGAIFAPIDDSLLGILRAIYRGRHLG
jgi:transcriptional regulator with XRE-family HTH domain